MAHGQLRIEQMYAYIALDPTDNTEGVVGQVTEHGMIPMVGADAKRIESLRPFVEDLVRATGQKITLVRFEVRTEVEEFNP